MCFTLSTLLLPLGLLPLPIQGAPLRKELVAVTPQGIQIDSGAGLRGAAAGLAATYNREAAAAGLDVGLGEALGEEGNESEKQYNKPLPTQNARG